MTLYGAYLHGQPDEQPSAYLSVEHHPEETSQSLLTFWPGAPKVPTSMRYEDAYRDDSHAVHPWHESGLIDNPNAHNPDYDGPDDAPIRPARENEQLQLFSYTPARPSKVSILVSNEDMGSKISAMTLLGMADLDARKTTGRPLQTSDNLSEHSMRIVRHLGDAGAIPSHDIPHQIENGFSFETSRLMLGSLPNLYTAQSMNGAEDVTYNASSAKRHIGQLMRPGRGERKAKETEKHTQLKLPGFD